MKLSKYNLAFFTGSRSEYSLSKNIIKKLKKNKNKVYTIVSGTHLSAEHGNTYKEIINDNIKIDYKIKIDNFLKQNNNINLIISHIIFKLNKILLKTVPDFIILTGDRFETLAAALCAYYLKIPIIHFHGGELTYGSLDDSARHAISKLSSLHFVSHFKYKKRLIQMGEDKKNIYVIGALGIENILNINYEENENLIKLLNYNLKERNIMVSYHPTFDKNLDIEFVNILQKLIVKFTNINFIITYPNNDSGYKYIIQKYLKIQKQNYKNVFIFKSLGSKNFLLFLKICDIILGNSSSGIIEAPYLNCFTINLGKRQDGRIMAKSIFNTKQNYNSIFKRINNIYSLKKQKSSFFSKNIFGKGNCSYLFVKKLNNINIKDFSIHKKFIDINF